MIMSTKNPVELKERSEIIINFKKNQLLQNRQKDN